MKEQTDGNGVTLGAEQRFRVGEWLVEPMANRIASGDEVRRLEPKVMEVLVCLAQHPGETVSKDRFMDEVWAGVVVTDDVLARCISELRKALGDEARDPRYIETIRKRGYLLVAPVEPAGPALLEPEASEPGVAEPEVGPAAAAAAEEAAYARAWAHAAEGGNDEQALERAPTAALQGGGAEVVEAVERGDAALEIASPAGDAPWEPLPPRRRRRRPALWAAVAVLLVAAGAFAVQRYIAARTEPLATVPVTSFVGEERSPALSPDGRRVAFAWDGGEGGAMDVYVQTVGGAEPVRLTTTPADEHSPAWNPEGTALAFARCDGAGCSIVEVPATGGAEREVVDLRPYTAEDLAWSPDGRTLAFSIRRGPNGAFGIALLPLTGGARPLRLTEPPASYPGDLDPAWSPDSRRIAFVRTAVDGRQDVGVVEAVGGRLRRIAVEQKGISGLDWTADGRHLIYAANRDGTSGLWRVPAEGGTPRWVAVGIAGEVFAPSVAREGRGLAFAQRSAATSLVLLGRDERVADRAPLIASTRWDAHPDVSPDGEQIAFVSTRSGSHEVWTARADGTGLTKRTDFGGPRVSTPRWSPDGRRIVFSARMAGHADLYVLGPAGPPERLTEDAADDVAPAWSRDGRSLYFASNRGGSWQIWRRPAQAGGTAEPVTRNGGIAAAETPDGADLLVVRPEQRGLWRLPARLDQNAELLVPGFSPADWANWFVREEGLYLVQRRASGVAELFLFDPATARATRLAVVADVPDQLSLAVFPDGQRFLVTRVERSDSDIVLVPDFR